MSTTYKVYIREIRFFTNQKKGIDNIQIYVTTAKFEPSVIVLWKRYFQTNFSTLSKPVS